MKISVVLIFVVILLYMILRPWKQISFYGLKIKKESFFLFLSCLILLLVAAIRGDFETDYQIYHWQFESYRDMPWWNIFEVRDIGFFIWCKLVFLFSGNVLLGFISMALVMMMMYYRIIKEESTFFLMSLVLFISVDNYIISFNLMRYILVVSIYMNIAEYIVDRKPLKYVVGVILLSTLHRAAIVTLPFYWLMQIDYRKKKNTLLLVCGISAILLLLLFTRPIAEFIQALIGMEYNTDSGLNYGSLGSFLKTGALLVFIILFRSKVNYDDIKERVWTNGCLFTVVFHCLAINVLMLHRMAYWFSGFYILLIPLILSRLPRKLQQMVSVVMIVCLVIYCQFVQNIQDYYPFWENVKVRY